MADIADRMLSAASADTSIMMTKSFAVSYSKLLRRKVYLFCILSATADNETIDKDGIPDKVSSDHASVALQSNKDASTMGSSNPKLSKYSGVSMESTQPQICLCMLMVPSDRQVQVPFKEQKSNPANWMTTQKAPQKIQTSTGLHDRPYWLSHVQGANRWYVSRG